MSHSKTKILTVRKETFGQRIEYIITNQGISKAWVADKLGISKQGLNYLLKNANKPKFIDEIAELLKINPVWIETGEGQPWVDFRERTLEKKLPVLTQSNFEGTKLGAFQEYISFSGIEKTIAFRLEDASNFPPFVCNSILLFDTEKIPKNEDYVLIEIENNIYVRQVLIDDFNICYQSSSVQYKTFINPKSFKILGVLFEARYQL